MNILPKLQYAQYLDHLLGLNEDDRYLRFCSVYSDDAIKNYVSKISSSDVIIVEYSADLKIIGAVQMIFYKNPQNEQIAEIGISVLSEYRGHGIAKKLLERAILYGKNHGIDKMETLCLLTNRRMQHLATNSGLTVRETDEGKQAVIELDSPDSFSLAHEVFSDYIGICEIKTKEMNYFANNIFEKVMYPLKFFTSMNK